MAVVDGQEQEVRSIDGTVVAIDLQGDLDGATVELRYEPIGERVFLPSLAAATIVLLTVVVLSLVLDRRARRRENGLHADETGSTE